MLNETKLNEVKFNGTTIEELMSMVERVERHSREVCRASEVELPQVMIPAGLYLEPTYCKFLLAGVA